MILTEDKWMIYTPFEVYWFKADEEGTKKARSKYAELILKNPIHIEIRMTKYHKGDKV